MKRKAFTAERLRLFQRLFGPWREKVQVDQTVFCGSLVHGEKKGRWTKWFSEGVWSTERKSAGGPNSFLWKFGPGRGKMRVDQIIFRGNMVQGEKKRRWTKSCLEVVWSMRRKSANGPNSFQQEYGPWGEKERVDQIVFSRSMVHGEKRINGPNLRHKD